MQQNPHTPFSRVSRAGRCGLLGMLFVGFLPGCSRQPAAAGTAGPVPVTIAAAITNEVQNFEEFTGRVFAKESVDVHARVTGYLDVIDFKDREGTEVKAGERLFLIDPKPFKAAYDNALAQVALTKANRDYRKAELARNEELVKTSAVSKSEYDQSAAAFKQAEASVTATEATAEGAKLNLDFTEVRREISGRIGAAKITEGNLVVADQTLLATIVSVEPMHVKFDVDERRWLRIQQEVREGKIKAQHGQEIPVEMALDNDKGYPHLGTIDFADNQFDKATGTIQLRGVFSNPRPPQGGRC